MAYLLVLIAGVVMATGPMPYSECRERMNAIPPGPNNETTAGCIGVDRVRSYQPDADYGREA